MLLFYLIFLNEKLVPFRSQKVPTVEDTFNEIYSCKLKHKFCIFLFKRQLLAEAIIVCLLNMECSRLKHKRITSCFVALCRLECGVVMWSKLLAPMDPLQRPFFYYYYYFFNVLIPSAVKKCGPEAGRGKQ